MVDEDRPGGPLPDSGEPGATRPVPGSLPRPELWPPGTQERPYARREEQGASRPSAGQRRLIWLSVALLVVAAVVLGLAVLVARWWPVAVAVVLGVAGAVLGLRSRILQDVSVTDSPTGHA